MHFAMRLFFGFERNDDKEKLLSVGVPPYYKRGEKMKNTRLIVDGAIFIILLLAALYIPIIGIVLMLALPLLFIVFTMKYQSKYAFLLLVVASFVTSIVSSPLNIAITLMFGITGIVLGVMYRKQKSGVEILLIGTLVYMINIVVIYIVSVKLFEYNFVQQFQAMFAQSITQTEHFMKMTGAQIDEKQLQQLKQFPQLIGYVIPSMIAIGSFMMAWLTQVVSAPILKRLRYPVQPRPPFRQVQLPKSILFYYLIFLAISVFVKTEAGSYLYIVQLNLNVIFPLLMVVQGFSFILFYAHYKKFPKVVSILFVVIAMIVPIVFYIVSILGIIDLGFSLRKRIQSV
ncbi:YybS family protein [Microbacteriaceae bacterium 4G12]